MSNIVINDLLVLDELTESELRRVLGGKLSRTNQWINTKGGLPKLNPHYKPDIIQSPSGHDFGQHCVDDPYAPCPGEGS